MTLLDILKGIEIPDEMGTYSECDELSPSADWYISEVLREAKKAGINITYAYGASQLCFIEVGKDWVYKIPFDGQIEEYSAESER